MATRTLTVKLVGDAKNLNQAFGKAGSSVKNFSKLAGAALLGVGTAVAGFGVKALGEFADFERGMNEVFTLLPGISGDAMAQMSDQVKQLSSDMGVLPEEVVPALYQAISAGVPQDNVFSFLETAQMAAVGGVSDLETAVDGISSVVNAYGADVLSATEASDLMFTAVKLGKTDFEQLSSSLFNVAPVASALGVQFGDVAAGLAALTAQGTPTSVATTQIRQLFVELSKAGSVAQKQFDRMTEGQSFSDFIAEGNNVYDALLLIQEAAESDGKALQDMFGSVEAAQAAMGLLKGDAFTNALDEMGESAGATAAAYETMDNGVGRNLDKLKAKFSVAMIEIGEKLAPVAVRALDWILEAADRWGPAISRAFDKVSAAVGMIVGIFQGGGGFEGAVGRAGEVMGRVGAAIGAAVQRWAPVVWDKLKILAKMFGEWVKDAVPPMMERLGELIGKLTSWIRDNLGTISDKLLEWAEAFVRWVAPMIPPLLVELAKLAAAIIEWAVLDLAPKLLQVMARLGVSAFQAWWKAMKDFWGGTVLPWLQGLPALALSAFMKLIGFLKNLGRQAMLALWEGLKSVWNDIVSWVDSKTQWLQDAVGWVAGPFGGDGGGVGSQDRSRNQQPPGSADPRNAIPNSSRLDFGAMGSSSGSSGGGFSGMVATTIMLDSRVIGEAVADYSNSAGGLPIKTVNVR